MFGIAPLKSELSDELSSLYVNQFQCASLSENLQQQILNTVSLELISV